MLELLGAQQGGEADTSGKLQQLAEVRGKLFLQCLAANYAIACADSPQRNL